MECHIIDMFGDIMGTLSSGEDITERKKTEIELKELTKELQRSNLELEEFLILLHMIYKSR